MFARLMGLKTVSPEELHRWLQDSAPFTQVPHRPEWRSPGPEDGVCNVHVMSAGVSGWLASKLTTESGEPAPA